MLEHLDPILKTFWFVAIPTSVIFIIQSILTFMGTDAHDGIDADFDSNITGDIEAPFQLFSLRNLINFLLGFSWTGISFYSTVSNKTLLILLAILVGIVFVWAFFKIISSLKKLEENNAFKLSDTLHQTAQVYLSIPAQQSGTGKITLSIKGAFHELEALTKGEKIETGTPVKIVEIKNNSLLVVEKN